MPPASMSSPGTHHLACFDKGQHRQVPDFSVKLLVMHSRESLNHVLLPKPSGMQSSSALDNFETLDEGEMLAVCLKDQEQHHELHIPVLARLPPSQSQSNGEKELRQLVHQMDDHISTVWSIGLQKTMDSDQSSGIDSEVLDTARTLAGAMSDHVFNKVRHHWCGGSNSLLHRASEARRLVEQPCGLGSHEVYTDVASFGPGRYAEWKSDTVDDSFLPCFCLAWQSNGSGRHATIASHAGYQCLVTTAPSFYLINRHFAFRQSRGLRAIYLSSSKAVVNESTGNRSSEFDLVLSYCNDPNSLSISRTPHIASLESQARRFALELTGVVKDVSFNTYAKDIKWLQEPLPSGSRNAGTFVQWIEETRAMLLKCVDTKSPNSDSSSNSVDDRVREAYSQPQPGWACIYNLLLQLGLALSALTQDTDYDAVELGLLSRLLWASTNSSLTRLDMDCDPRSLEAKNDVTLDAEAPTAILHPHGFFESDSDGDATGMVRERANHRLSSLSTLDTPHAPRDFLVGRPRRLRSDDDLQGHSEDRRKRACLELRHHDLDSNKKFLCDARRLMNLSHPHDATETTNFVEKWYMLLTQQISTNFASSTCELPYGLRKLIHDDRNGEGTALDAFDKCVHLTEWLGHCEDVGHYSSNWHFKWIVLASLYRSSNSVEALASQVTSSLEETRSAIAKSRQARTKVPLEQISSKSFHKHLQSRKDLDESLIRIILEVYKVMHNGHQAYLRKVQTQNSTLSCKSDVNTRGFLLKRAHTQGVLQYYRKKARQRVRWRDESDIDALFSQYLSVEDQASETSTSTEESTLSDISVLWINDLGNGETEQFRTLLVEVLQQSCFPYMVDYLSRYNLTGEVSAKRNVFNWGNKRRYVRFRLDLMERCVKAGPWDTDILACPLINDLITSPSNLLPYAQRGLQEVEYNRLIVTGPKNKFFRADAKYHFPVMMCEADAQSGKVDQERRLAADQAVWRCLERLFSRLHKVDYYCGKIRGTFRRERLARGSPSQPITVIDVDAGDYD